MPLAALTERDDLLAELIHELRQPLSTIQNSESYLRLLLAQADEPVHEQLRLIARQVDLAARILSEVSHRGKSSRSLARVQRADAGASLERTKSQTAAVT